MTKLLLLTIITIWSTGCTLIGFYYGTQIDESKHYSIKNPTYDSLNIEIGTPISLHLNADETINGRFSKVLLLNNSLSQNSTLLNNEFDDTLLYNNSDSISSRWTISLHTHDGYVEIPDERIETIDVKPYSNTIIITTGVGILLDILTYYTLKNTIQGPG